MRSIWGPKDNRVIVVTHRGMRTNYELGVYDLDVDKEEYPGTVERKVGFQEEREGVHPLVNVGFHLPDSAEVICDALKDKFKGWYLDEEKWT
ncbi:MAG: hypothetical protein V3V78_03475, partial [Candidatus Woesearchaeota archaeon]